MKNVHLAAPIQTVLSGYFGVWLDGMLIGQYPTRGRAIATAAQYPGSEVR